MSCLLFILQAPLCRQHLHQLNVVYACGSHVAGDIGSPSLARAPVDTTPRLGAVSVTREAKQKLQLLEGLKRVFETCEKGKVTTCTNLPRLMSQEARQEATHCLHAQDPQQDDL